MGTFQRMCKVPGCGEFVSGSEEISRDRAARGQSEETRCPRHKAEHDRLARGTTALPYVETVAARPDRKLVMVSEGFNLKGHPDTAPVRVDASSRLPELRERFSLTDDDLRDILNSLKEHQVVVVVSGTGTGKSTLLPYSLVEPPEGTPRDIFTSLGQVVVTQPRIAPTEAISDFVGSALIGTGVGPKFEVGFRNSEAPSPTDDNRLVYTTDGTLINWILSGRLDDFSVVMIDEAHERSLNIDLILGMLKRDLRLYPNLRVLVASATIDASLFRDFFGGESKVPVLRFEGVNYGYDLHRPEEALATDLRDSQAADKLIREAARTAAEVIGSVLDGSREQGDVLVFVATRKHIDSVMGRLADLLSRRYELGAVEVLPLHAQLSPTERRRVLADRPAGGPPRVIVATNIAETSLTVPGVRYVVDSGLVLQTRWDTASLRTSYSVAPHSQDGCVQRWGRAGRTSHGEVFTLYTKEQFAELDEHTPPEIQCAPLEAVVLKAKAAGVDDVAEFPWIEKPALAELSRAERRLVELGAIDEDGDLTARGAELAGFPMSPEHGAVMIEADRLCCAQEAAVLLGYMGPGGGKPLFLEDREWSASTRMIAADAHRALQAGCADDLELLLKVHLGWKSSEDAERWAATHFVDHELMCRIESGRERLLSGLSRRKKEDEDRASDFALGRRLCLVLARCLPHQVYALADDGETYTPAFGHGDSVRLSGRTCSAAGGAPPSAFVALGQPRLADSRSGRSDLVVDMVACVVPACSRLSVASEVEYLDAVRLATVSHEGYGSRPLASLAWPLGSRVLCRARGKEPTILKVVDEGPCPEFRFQNGVRRSALARAEVPAIDLPVDYENSSLEILADEFVPGALPSSKLPSMDGLSPVRARLTAVQGAAEQSEFVGVVVGFDVSATSVVPVVDPVDPLQVASALETEVVRAGGRLALALVVVRVFQEGVAFAAELREPASGASFVVDDGDLTVPPFGVLATTSPGDTLPMVIEVGADGALCVTGLRASLAALQRRSDEEQVGCVGRPVVASDNRKSLLRLTEPRPYGRVLSVPRAKLGNSPHGLAPLLNVVLRPQNLQAEAFSAVEIAPEALELAGILVGEGGRLKSSRPITWDEYRALLVLSDEVEWVAAVTTLLRDSNRVAFTISEARPVAPAVGEIVRARVTGIQTYGLFVLSESGTPGLLHRSDMPRGWDPLRFSPGDWVDVEVVSVDLERGRFKGSAPAPRTAPLPESGALLPARVTRLERYGAFVKLADGHTALVHISQLADRFVRDPGEVLTVGDDVTVRVLEVVPGPRPRIAASLKGASGASRSEVSHGAE